jgi:hypothetical protein
MVMNDLSPICMPGCYNYFILIWYINHTHIYGGRAVCYLPLLFCLRYYIHHAACMDDTNGVYVCMHDVM